MKQSNGLPFTFSREKDCPSVLTVRFTERIAQGWECWFLLTTDRHWDNPMSDRAMQRRHLDEALKRRAGIFDAGDLFCAMQGRDDKRGSKSSVRQEDARDAYYDSLVDGASDWFAPYARNWVMSSPGNHESAVLKRHETNLTERFVALLNSKGKGNAVRMTYAGWVRFMFQVHTDHRQSAKMFYHHGWGGGGPVTRGVIDTNRMAVYQDAELVWTGHTHDSWLVPIARARLTTNGVPYRDEQLHFRTPGYKDEWTAMEGFHIEKGRGPKPLGAAWLRFFYQDRQIAWEVVRAT